MVNNTVDLAVGAVRSEMVCIYICNIDIEHYFSFILLTFFIPRCTYFHEFHRNENPREYVQREYLSCTVIQVPYSKISQYEYTQVYLLSNLRKYLHAKISTFTVYRA